jgi:hypothetical protein
MSNFRIISTHRKKLTSLKESSKFLYSMHDSDFLFRNYNLLFKRLSNRGGISTNQDYSTYVKRIHEAENALINSVRLLSVLTNNNQGATKKSNETQSVSGKKKSGANQVKGGK